MADKGKKRKGAGGDEPAKKKAKQETAAASAADPAATLAPFDKQIQESVAQEEKEHKAVQAKYAKLRKPIYAKRDAAVASIEGFWEKALLGHPTIKALASENETDLKLLSFVTKVEVDEVNPDTFKLTLHFKANDLISNKSLSRTQTVEEGEDDEAELKIENSGINWKVKDVSEESFFNLLFGKESPATGDMASIAEEFHEVYKNPLPFFSGEILAADSDDSDGEAPTLVEDEDE